MKKISQQIVFFGSGPVAAVSLASLLDNFSLEAVITKQIPPHHKELAPVEQIAKRHGIPTFFATTKKELDLLFKKHHFNSPLGLVVDYGVIISKEVIDYFDLGIINSHFSLLPRLRGADPISFAILNGDSETGVSLMCIVPALDEGKLISQEKLVISPDATTPALTKQLVRLSNTMLNRDLPRYMAGKLALYDQPPQKPSYSRKLTKQDGWFDLTKPAEVLEREIRAFTGWPKSRLAFQNNVIVITRARVASSKDNGNFVLTCGKNTFLEIEELIAPSGKKMSGAAYLRGYAH